MEDFSDQISRLSQELRTFQLNLERDNLQHTSHGNQDEVMDQVLNAGLGEDLKKTVDLLNYFLWRYIEAAAATDANADIDYARQSSRLGQITEILRALHHSSCPLKNSFTSVEHAAMTIASHSAAVTSQKKLPLGKSA
jgi:hypothetical protein